MHEKFTFQVEVNKTTDVHDQPYDEVSLSVSSNGYQWWTNRFPASKWPEIRDAIESATKGR